MKWNGIVSQSANQKIATRLSAEKTAQPIVSASGLYGQRSARICAVAWRSWARERVPLPPPGELTGLPGDKLIALTPHGLDQVEAELGAQPPDAHVHHVRARVEVVAPDGGQQRALGHRLPDVLGELAQQQELQPGQRHGPVADVGDQPPDVEGDVTRLDRLDVRMRVAARGALGALGALGAWGAWGARRRRLRAAGLGRAVPRGCARGRLGVRVRLA